jgi:hypothetical protein
MNDHIATDLEIALTNCLVEFSEKNEDVSVAQVMAALLLRSAQMAVFAGGDLNQARTAYIAMATRAFDGIVMIDKAAPHIPVGNA